MPRDLTPQAVLARLDEIDVDLARRQNDYERLAADLHRLKRDHELAHARAYMKAEGKTVGEREAVALLALAEDQSTIDYHVALGAYEGCKAVVRVLDTRASIGQSILKAMGRA